MEREPDKDKKSPQQRPEDAERQNAKQEREYREQKYGDKKKPPKRATEENAIEKYINIVKKEKKRKDDL